MKATIAQRVSRSACVLMVALLISHCGRFGYEEVSSLTKGTCGERTGADGRPGNDGPAQDPAEGDGSVAEPDSGASDTLDDAGAEGGAQIVDDAGSTDAGTHSTLQDGLVAYWSIDEGSGATVSDRGVHGNHGQIVGAVGWTDSARGSVLDLSDQVANHVTVPASASIDGITTAFSISAWVFTRGSGWEQAIVSRQRGQGTDQHYSLQIFQNQIQLQLGSNRVIYAPPSIATDTWLHIAATYDGANAKIYLDGEEQTASTIVSPLTADTTPVLLGSKQENQNIWSAMNGYLDSLRLYDRALTAAEVAELSQ